MIENGGDQSGPDNYDVYMKYSESHAVTKFITRGATVAIPIADTFRNNVLCNIFQKVSWEWLNEIHACLM